MRLQLKFETAIPQPPLTLLQTLSKLVLSNLPIGLRSFQTISFLFLTEHWLLADLADDQPSMMVSVDYWQHPDKKMRSKNRNTTAMS